MLAKVLPMINSLPRLVLHVASGAMDPGGAIGGGVDDQCAPCTGDAKLWFGKFCRRECLCGLSVQEESIPALCHRWGPYWLRQRAPLAADGM